MPNINALAPFLTKQHGVKLVKRRAAQCCHWTRTLAKSTVGTVGYPGLPHARWSVAAYLLPINKLQAGSALDQVATSTNLFHFTFPKTHKVPAVAGTYQYACLMVNTLET